MGIWNTDAQFATQVDKEYIFTNRKIDAFLNTYDQFIVVASKGMGKTLLMRLKRSIIEKEDPGMLLVPQNETCDYVSLPESPIKELVRTMHDPSFWEDAWKLAISISCLLNFPHHLTPAEKTSASKELQRVYLPLELRDDLMAAFEGQFRKKRFPSGVLDIFLQEGKKSIENVRSSALQVLHDLFITHISSGCIVFIDSFDQTLNKLFPENLEIWCAAQNGLLRAAWELSRHNRHVKVYTTIRQEAYASFSNAERINISGSVLLIEYERPDLKQIFLNAIRQYEGINNISEFLGFDKMYNGYLRNNEDAFEYICRHTIGIPRWLMTIGQKISNARTDKGMVTDKRKRKILQKRVANIVNEVSAVDLAYEYLRSEMRPFFRYDDPDIFIANLISKINSSVLSYANLVRISGRFVDEHSCSGTKHPFCLLYNLGLLGYVDRSPSSTDRHQIFKKPYEFDWNYEQILPINPSTYYLLHPALHYLIQRRNYKFTFNMVRIGDELQWTEKEEARIKSEKIKIFLSYSHLDMDVVEKIAIQIETFLNLRSVIHDIWLDKWKMRAGKWVQDQISEGLMDADFLILIASRNSLGSNAVDLEWKTKFSAKISRGQDTVFPFIIDDTPFDTLPQFLKDIYCYRYQGDDTKVQRLVEDILFWRAEQASVRPTA